MAVDVRGWALKIFHLSEVIKEMKDYRNPCADFKSLTGALYALHKVILE